MPEPDLWLDPRDAKPFAFVSHAHADHVARHPAVLCSEVTAVLLRHRYGLTPKQLHAVAFHVPLVRDGYRLRLLPAGHIPGSAMLHVTRLADNATLLYTGDFKTRRSRTAESAVFLTAETLVMETTFGLPGYEFPGPLEVEGQVLRFIDDAIADGETPVLLCYSLGKAQEAQALLQEHAVPVLLHPAVAAMTRACREAGVAGLPEPVEFDGHAAAGQVLIAPPAAVRTSLFKGLKAKRTAMLSGWALQPGARYRYCVDAMIPLSDHADYPGLLECVQRVKPKRVVTVHGYAAAFAADLRARGINAWSAAGTEQLEFSIHRLPAAGAIAPRRAWHKRVACPLAGFSDLCRMLGETGSRVAKVRFIAAYLATLEDDDALHVAVRWLACTTTRKPAGVVDKNQLRHALAMVPGVRDERLRDAFLTDKALGRVARQVLGDVALQPEGMDFGQVEAFMAGFAAGAGMDRLQRLARRLATLHPAESETLVRLMTRSLGLDLPAGCLAEAVAEACGADTAQVAAACAITGCLATVAVLARHGRLADARPPAARPGDDAGGPAAADGGTPALF